MLCRALHLTSVTYTVITKGGYVTERHDPYASGGRSATLMPNHKVFHVMSPPRRAIPPRFHHTSAESQVLSRSATIFGSVLCSAVRVRVRLSYTWGIYLYPGITCTRQVLWVLYDFHILYPPFCEFCNMSISFLYPYSTNRTRTLRNTRGVYPGTTLTQQLCEVCKTFIPIPDKSVLFPTTTERIIRTLQNITLHFLQACTSKALNLKWTPASHHNITYPYHSNHRIIITYPYHFNHRINPIGKRIEKQCLLRLFLMQPTSGRKHKDRGFCSRK